MKNQIIVTESLKRHCADSVAAHAVGILQSKYPQIPADQLRDEFFSSNTYNYLIDIEQGLWGTGPAIVVDEFEQEKTNCQS